MKFLLVITNLRGGGAEKAILKTATALLEQGVKVVVVTLESRVDYDMPAGLECHALTGAQQKMAKGWLGKRLLASKLRQFAGQIQPDVVVSTLPFADEVTHLAGLPNHWCRVANTLSEEIAALAEKHPAKAKRRLKRYQSIYGQHGLVAVSAGVAEDLRHKLGLKSQIVEIPNPFVFAVIRKQARQTLDRDTSRPYVVHVGRFAPQKRHDLLLDAWQQLDIPHQLVLLADTSPALERLIQDRGLDERVTIAGFQKNPYPWMRQADLLVLCSDHEGLPNVLIEALICDTPVVSTDCPSGPRQILGDGLPECLVPVGDVERLKTAITACLKQPPDIARVDLQRYQSGQVAQAYQQLAGGHG